MAEYCQFIDSEIGDDVIFLDDYFCIVDSDITYIIFRDMSDALAFLLKYSRIILFYYKLYIPIELDKDYIGDYVCRSLDKHDWIWVD